MGNRHHAHLLRIGEAEVERVSKPDGKSYHCRSCESDRCRHVKVARDQDSLHLTQTGKHGS